MTAGAATKRLLVTGAAGKVGRAAITPKLIDAAYDYRRAGDDPRIVWYPG